MKYSWTLLSSTMLCSVALLGCTPEAKQSLNEAKNESAEAAKATGTAVKEVASDAAEAVSDATKSAVDATKDAFNVAAEKAGQAKDAIVDKASDAGKAIQDATTTDMAKLSESLNKLTVEQREVVTDFQSSFSQTIGKLSSALVQVTDADSAKNALPTIEEANAKLGELGSAFATLPEAAKPYVAHVVNASREQIKNAINALLANPSVKEVLDPVINTLNSNFDAFKAS